MYQGVCLAECVSSLKTREEGKINATLSVCEFTLNKVSSTHVEFKTLRTMCSHLHTLSETMHV